MAIHSTASVMDHAEPLLKIAHQFLIAQLIDQSNVQLIILVESQLVIAHKSYNVLKITNSALVKVHVFQTLNNVVPQLLALRTNPICVKTEYA
jgi:hypothetical protein